MEEDPPVSMVVYGARLGARNVSGLANWSEEVIDSPVMGMINNVSQSPHPKDGLRRRVTVEIRNKKCEWLHVATAFYDGQCRLESYESQFDELIEIGKIPDDTRLRVLVDRYQSKIPTLDCMSTQREWPLQSPHHSWALLRPGDIEVF